MMKHIVFVVGNYKNGGVPMRSTNLANEFAKKGYSVDILVTKEIADDVYFVREDGVNLISLKEFTEANKTDSDYIKIKNKWTRRICLLKKLRYITKYFPAIDKKLEMEIHDIRKGEELLCYTVNHRDSVYIAFGIGCFEQAFCAAKTFGSKAIYAERNAPDVDFPKDSEKRARLMGLLKNAAGAVLQTHEELEFFGNTFKETEVIRNPVKAGLPEPYTETRRNVIVNFCRIANQKNLPLMIRAFIKLHEIYPDYSLEIYGNTVAENEEKIKEELIRMIAELGAEKYIKILPPRGDIHGIIRDCAMFVSSSDFEGLSNSMIEAMAIGLPCICTDCLGGGAREMIRHGENGLLVPMNDADALCDAMKLMIEDSSLAQKCSQNAAQIRDELSVDRIAQLWIDFIEKIAWEKL